MENQKKFGDQILNALIHFLYNFFVYFLFLLPFALWKKATIRLSDQREKGSLNLSKITSLWPFFSFLKSFFLEFLFDGFIFIGYFAGVVFSIYVYNETKKEESLLLILAGTYYSPIGLSLLRDLFQLLILPLKKFINWCSKPAQYLDLKIINDIVKKREKENSDNSLTEDQNIIPKTPVVPDKPKIDPSDL